MSVCKWYKLLNQADCILKAKALGRTSATEDNVTDFDRLSFALTAHAIEPLLDN